MPPPNRVLINASVCPPTCDAGRLTSVRVPRSPPKKAPQIHMFCTVMLRCESSAGLGDPVEPVVNITSAPSSSLTPQSIPSSAPVPASAKARSAGSAIDANERVPGTSSSESIAMECSIQLHCACTARHSGRRSSGPFTPNPTNPRGRRISSARITSAADNRRSSGATITPILKQPYSSRT